MTKIRPAFLKKFINFKLKSNFLPVLILLLFLLNLGLGLVFLQIRSATNDQSSLGNKTIPEELPEITFLASKDWSFDSLKVYFQDLSERKGAEYAFEVLRLAPLPENIDLHLLGHVVGDKLFAQKGIEGIKLCTQDLRNACSHSIVVGYFLEKGENGLEAIARTCRDAPGGPGAYTMCFHGLGHGILAFKDYNLEETIKICNKTGSEKYNNREAIECIGGAVMEIIGGGGHNRDLWEKQNKVYLSKTDPLSPCKGPFMPQDARNQCLNYLTPHLFNLAGADLGYPEKEDIEEAFKYCNNSPNKDEQNACFGGFGKEFVVLAQERDIRRIDQMQKDQLLQVYSWCELAKEEEGIKSCLEQAINSLFWGGENDPQTSIDFCSITENTLYKADCYKNLFENIRTYIKSEDDQRSICAKLPENEKNECFREFVI